MRTTIIIVLFSLVAASFATAGWKQSGGSNGWTKTSGSGWQQGQGADPSSGWANHGSGSGGYGGSGWQQGGNNGGWQQSSYGTPSGWAQGGISNVGRNGNQRDSNGGDSGWKARGNSHTQWRSTGNIGKQASSGYGNGWSSQSAW